MTTKICNQCNTKKPLTDFHKAKTKDGIMSRCKVCYNQRHLDKSARVVRDPNGDVMEENKLTRHENALIREFLTKREKESKCKSANNTL